MLKLLRQAVYLNDGMLRLFAGQKLTLLCHKFSSARSATLITCMAMSLAEQPVLQDCTLIGLARMG